MYKPFIISITILDAVHKENIVNKVCIIRAYETNML